MVLEEIGDDVDVFAFQPIVLSVVAMVPIALDAVDHNSIIVAIVYVLMDPTNEEIDAIQAPGVAIAYCVDHSAGIETMAVPN